MFDPEAFGAAMGELVRAAVEPLEKRIDELQTKLKAAPDFHVLVAAEVEKRMAAIPAPANGKDVDMVVVSQMVADAVAALPVPKNGEPGEDGKSLGLDDLRPVLNEAIEQMRKDADAAIAEPLELAAKARDKLLEDLGTLKQPEDGKSVTMDDVRPVLDAAVQALRKEAEAAIAEPLALAKSATETLLARLGEIKQPENGRSVTVDDVAPFISAEIEKAVAKLPTPKDGLGLAGAMIDRDGALQITLTNGEVKSLGTVVGKNGDDGVSLDGFELEYLPESHEVVLKATAAGRIKELRYPAGGIRPAGYWREGTRAKAGEAWVNDGSLWIAVKDCQSQPGLNDEGWIIAARKGRDGEHGRAPKAVDTSAIKLKS